MEIATVKLDLTRNKWRCFNISIRNLTDHEARYARYNCQCLRIETIEIVKNPYTGDVERKRVYINIKERDVKEIVDKELRFVRIYRDYVKSVAGNILYRTLNGYVEIDITPGVMDDIASALFKMMLRRVELEKHIDWLNYSRSEFGKKRKECGKGVYNFSNTYYGATRTSKRYIIEEDNLDDIHKIYEDELYFEED